MSASRQRELMPRGLAPDERADRGDDALAREGGLALVLPAEVVALIVERVTERVLNEVRAERKRDDVSPYMTIPEAADYLRCSRQRVDDLLSARRLTRVKEGRRTLVLRGEIEEHLRRCSE